MTLDTHVIHKQIKIMRIALQVRSKFGSRDVLHEHPMEGISNDLPENTAEAGIFCDMSPRSMPKSSWIVEVKYVCFKQNLCAKLMFVSKTVGCRAQMAFLARFRRTPPYVYLYIDWLTLSYRRYRYSN